MVLDAAASWCAANMLGWRLLALTPELFCGEAEEQDGMDEARGNITGWNAPCRHVLTVPYC